MLESHTLEEAKVHMRGSFEWFRSVLFSPENEYMWNRLSASLTLAMIKTKALSANSNLKFDQLLEKVEGGVHL